MIFFTSEYLQQPFYLVTLLGSLISELKTLPLLNRAGHTKNKWSKNLVQKTELRNIYCSPNLSAPTRYWVEWVQKLAPLVPG